MAEPSVAAPAQAARRVVSVRDLVVDFVQDTGTTRAPAGSSLDLYAGRVLGVVGESGCGKRSATLAPSGTARPVVAPSP